MTSTTLSDWLEAHPKVRSITPAICDLNGVLRGKRVPREHAGKLASGGVKLPFSALFADIWGRDLEGSGQVLETGDGDGVLMPTGRGPLMMPDGTSAILPMWMFDEAGGAYEVDPRHALARITARYADMGLTPVCATELEFYVYKASDDGSIAPPDRAEANLYSIAELDDYKLFLDDLYAACADLGVPAETAISESGVGQLEINLVHQPDPLRAADDAVLFKYIVKSVAARHGLTATFMAKPYGDDAGCGFHTHFSVLNKDGVNIFSDGTDLGSDALRHAVAGLMDNLADSTLIFAPHSNSYRRLRAGTHAPVNIAWGYDNRTASIRIPSSPDVARRIEHRVAGADANPYLSLTAILGAALMGLEAKANPPAAIEGNVYASGAPILPQTWRQAIDLFRNSEGTKAIFGEQIVHLYGTCKAQEFDKLATRVPLEEYNAYLKTV